MHLMISGGGWELSTLARHAQDRELMAVENFKRSK